MAKLKISKDQERLSTGALLWLIVGLMMAVGGYIWLGYIDTSKSDVGTTLGGASLVSFGLLVAGSSLFILAAVVMTTNVKKRRASRRKK